MSSPSVAAEVARSSTYESPYRPAEIISMLADAAFDAYRAGGVGDGITLDYSSVDFDYSFSPFMLHVAYSLSVNGIYVLKTTTVTSGCVYQTAYVTGNIGELSSAYWTSAARPSDRGTTIRNTLSVTWHPKARCRLVRNIANRVAERRVIPPLVDKGLANIESKVRVFAHSGSVWAVIDALAGGLR